MFIIRTLVFFCCFLFLFSLYDSMHKENDFTRAQKAFDAEAWISAERLLTQYLRKEVNAEKSWQAWVLLLRLTRKTNLDTEIALTYLNDMLRDFSSDIEKRKYILIEIARAHESQGDVEKAIAAWERYISLDNMTPAELFIGYKQLIRHYFLLGNFEEVEIVLTDCSVLPLAAEDKAYCIYNLADLKAGLDQLDESSDLIQSVLDLDISKYAKAQAQFLYADILEQKKQYKKALEYFLMAENDYGNKEVVMLRIAKLKKRLKIK